MIVGPQAYVRIYRSTHPAEPGLWFFPRQSVEDLIQVGTSDELDSIQILSQAPVEGVTGYEAFVEAMKKKARERE